MILIKSLLREVTETDLGAAGKGAVLAHAISTVRRDFDVTDADSNRWGYSLEGSGKEVKLPTEIRDGLTSDAWI